MNSRVQNTKELCNRFNNACAPLAKSLTTLLSMAALSGLLAVCVVVQIAFLRPTPNKALALRQVIIPQASAVHIDDSFKYRHFISQIVQRHSKANFYDVRDLSDLIIRVSIEENIDPLFVAAIIKAESTFHIGAVSNRGARGLMQIRSGTAEYVSNLLDEPWQGERFLHDPEYNLRLGIAYLKYLSQKFGGNVEKVLAAYNWGPGNVKKSDGRISSLPEVTQKYIDTIIKNHNRWKSELQMQRAGLEVQSVEGSV